MKIMIFDQGHPVTKQLASKAVQVFDKNAEIVIAKISEEHPWNALDMLQKAVDEEQPQVLLIGATTLGEEIAPALGIRLGTGVAAHCIDMFLRHDGELTFMIPAFGGRVIGEIMIPDVQPGKPAIASVKPDIFQETADLCIDDDARFRMIELKSEEDSTRGFRVTGSKPRQVAATDLGKADLILCGGYGLGSEENWRLLEELAKALGGAAGCTRPVVDAGWGPDESSMIGTSGRSVRPKMYVGFGISGAAHHLCGIKDSDIIININKDKNADAFTASDYKCVFDAAQVLKALEEEIGI